MYPRELILNSTRTRKYMIILLQMNYLSASVPHPKRNPKRK